MPVFPSLQQSPSAAPSAHVSPRPPSRQCLRALSLKSNNTFVSMSPSFLQDPLLSTHNQNKSSTRAFSRSSDVTKAPPPFPASKQKAEQEPLVSVDRSVSNAGRSCPSVGVNSVLQLFHNVLVELTTNSWNRGQWSCTGAMKGEAEVKSLDRPSMLLLLFW